MWPFRNKTGDTKLAQRVFQVEEDLAQLRGAHERLRGAFYATRGKTEDPKPETKADVLRAAGYVPGRPFPHKG
jgi:hypothetical protein